MLSLGGWPYAKDTPRKWHLFIHLAPGGSRCGRYSLTVQWESKGPHPLTILQPLPIKPKIKGVYLPPWFYWRILEINLFPKNPPDPSRNIVGLMVETSHPKTIGFIREIPFKKGISGSLGHNLTWPRSGRQKPTKKLSTGELTKLIFRDPVEWTSPPPESSTRAYMSKIWPGFCRKCCRVFVRRKGGWICVMEILKYNFICFPCNQYIASWRGDHVQKES